MDGGHIDIDIDEHVASVAPRGLLFLRSTTTMAMAMVRRGNDRGAGVQGCLTLKRLSKVSTTSDISKQEACGVWRVEGITSVGME